MNPSGSPSSGTGRRQNGSPSSALASSRPASPTSRPGSPKSPSSHRKTPIKGNGQGNGEDDDDGEVDLQSMAIPKVTLGRRRSLMQNSDGTITRREGFGQDVQHLSTENQLESDVSRYLSNMSCHIDAVVRKYQNIPTTTYETKNILTDSFALNDDWQHFIAPKDLDGEVVEIAQIPFEKRSHDQKTHMVQWLCEKWPTARQMGIVKCMAMTKVLKHFSYKAGENIVTEGDTGLTFYIIIDGETEVHKGGVGVVARLGAGFSFGEIALSGKDTRTATVRAAAHNPVEVLSLHKLDYDRFVKDIQQAERREQFNFYRGLPMFSEWSRDRLERLGNSSFRKEFADGDVIFRQNDESDFFYFVNEGSVEVIKEIDIITRNRWPIGANGWDTLVNRTKETHTLHTCTRGHPFGEHSVLMSDNKPKPFISHDKDDSVAPPLRPYTAIARGRTIVFVVGRLEMLHVLVGLPSTEYDKVVQPARIKWDDLAILKNIPSVVGGPSSTAQAGDRLIYPNTVKVSTKVTPTPNPSQLNYSEQSAMLVDPQNHKGVHKQKFMTKAMREKEARSKSAFVLKRQEEDMGHSSHMKESDFNAVQEQMSEALKIAVSIKEKEREFQERLIVTDLEVPEKRGRMGLLGLCEWDEEGTSPASRIKTKTKSQSQYVSGAMKDEKDPRQPRPKSAYAQPSLRADRASLRSGSNTLASASKRISSRTNAAKKQLSYTFASGQCLGDILGGTGLPRRRPRTQSSFQRGAVDERDCSVVDVDAPQGPFADAHATAQDDAHASGCLLINTHAHNLITTGTGIDGDGAGGSTAPLSIAVPHSDAQVCATSDSAAVYANQSHTGPTARISRAGRRPATASETSSRSDASRSITFSPMQRNLRHYPKMFQGNGGRNRTPLAGVVQSNVVTTGSGRRTRTSCLAGVNEFSGPHSEDAADRARRERMATKMQMSKRQTQDISNREREATSTKGGKWGRTSELLSREEQRYRRMTESAFDNTLHDPGRHDALPYDTSDITDILVRRRSRPTSES